MDIVLTYYTVNLTKPRKCRQVVLVMGHFKQQLCNIQCSVLITPITLFASGETTVADWSVLRTAPSPWAELEFENIILSVPSDAIRGLERPDELAAHWDTMMRAIADLAAIPHKFPRKERFVTDVQISHGKHFSFCCVNREVLWTDHQYFT